MPRRRKPTRAALRVARRRQLFETRMAAATTGRERLGVCVSYLQAVLAAAIDQEAADAAARRAADHVHETAESVRTKEMR